MTRPRLTLLHIPGVIYYRNELWKNPASRIIYRYGRITLQQVQSAY